MPNRFVCADPEVVRVDADADRVRSERAKTAIFSRSRSVSPDSLTLKSEKPKRDVLIDGRLEHVRRRVPKYRGVPESAFDLGKRQQCLDRPPVVLRKRIEHAQLQRAPRSWIGVDLAAVIGHPRSKGVDVADSLAQRRFVPCRERLRGRD